MICFQNFRSLMSWTTIFAEVAKDWPLWFAFKIFDLWCREQQHSRLGGSSLRCDLLSKFSIFDVVNNYPAYFGGIGCVVICFQNFRSLMSWTTLAFQVFDMAVLWFAFKIFDLWCREQPLLHWNKQQTSCDLLSKFSIFDVVNNRGGDSY